MFQRVQSLPSQELCKSSGSSWWKLPLHQLDLGTSSFKESSIRTGLCCPLVYTAQHSGSFLDAGFSRRKLELPKVAPNPSEGLNSSCPWMGFSAKYPVPIMVSSDPALVVTRKSYYGHGWYILAFRRLVGI